MKDSSASSPASKNRAEIRDQQAITLLLNLSSARNLAPFLGRENTVSGAASELGVDIKAMFRWTQRFITCGLLEEIRSVPRSGRAIRHYQSIASEFLIPVAMLPLSILIGTDNLLHQEMQNALLRVWLKNSAIRPWGARIFLGGGRVAIDMSDGVSLQERISDSVTPSETRWFPLHLTLPDAQAFAKELRSLEERYKALEIAGEKTYLVHLAVVEDG
jgi:hypothetical protein